MYVGVYSAEYDNGESRGGEARRLKEILKDGGVRVKLGPSRYVGHRSIEIHEDDLTKASAVLVRADEKYVARCCRDVRKDRRESAWCRR